MKEKIKKSLRKEWHIPYSPAAEEATRRFTLTEKVIFRFFICIFVLGMIGLLWHVNKSFLKEIPKVGGTLREGIVGSPRFINPLLALSDADRDLTALVYSGLLKATPEGELIPDAAKEYTISADGLIYTVTLRDNVTFHNGEPITADDVIFTIARSQDSVLKSPKRASWEGVKVEKVDNLTVKFILKQPYSPFLENLTLGILPKNIWQNADAEQFPFSQYNIEPVGSGPYKIEKIKRNASGVPVYYHLSPFKDYALGRPFIKNIVIRFYSNENQALQAERSGDVDSVNAISPSEAKILMEKGVRVEHAPLPRIFGVFFNQNQAPVLSYSEVRLALGLALDREKIVSDVLSGYGSKIYSPIPREFIGGEEQEDGHDENPIDNEPNTLAEAQNILEKAGWTINPETKIWEKKNKKQTEILSFSISTANTPELEKTATLIKEMWEALGAKVDVRLFESNDLNQNVIRPRKYDSLLFGEIIGRDLDLYAFWHSSQRNDPGLNIALYTNTKADKLLDTARNELDKTKQIEAYKMLENEIKKDTPAVFIYTPDFLYVVPKNLRGLKLKEITVPPERFLNIHEWYIETEKVWEIFAEPQ